MTCAAALAAPLPVPALPPPGHLDGRVKVHAFVPFSVIDLGEGTQNLTKKCSGFHPTLTAISERRSGLPTVLQWIECVMDLAVL
jgi:hypothetical protein